MVLASFARGPVTGVTSKSVTLTYDVAPTYESRCVHISGINGLASLFNSCGKLAALVQTEAVPHRAKFHMILRIIYCREEEGEVSNYVGPETREKGRIETRNSNTNSNQGLKLTCPTFHRPSSYFLHWTTEMRREFVRKHFRIRETLIRTTQGVGWGRIRQRLVSRRSIGVCRVMRRGLEDILRELGDRGRMQNLRLCQQKFR